MYNAIKRKKCKCGCEKYPTLSCMGFNYHCLPEDLKEKVGEKKKLQIKNRNKRSTLINKIRIETSRESVKYSLLQEWFADRRKEMTGVCVNCGAKSERDNDKYFKWSISHLVAKSTVPSAATEPNNWLELCKHCHSEFDATFERASKMQCFELAKQKFETFKCVIPFYELRRINPNLVK